MSNEKTIIREKVYFGKDERASTKLMILYDSYGSSYGHINQLVSIAREDYPDLEDKKIKVRYLTCNRFKGIYGIEFYRKGHVQADNYTDITDPELHSV
jgi:hypothetical protein